MAGDILINDLVKQRLGEEYVARYGLVLKKAIEKALINGATMPVLTSVDGTSWQQEVWWYENQLDNDFYFIYIFDHGFAKAFWEDSRDNWICYKKGKWQRCHMNQSFSSETPFVYPLWQYHLMHMVVEKNPLTYLEKFL